jgi:geranylgeranyl diphosphate synthase, type II
VNDFNLESWLQTRRAEIDTLLATRLAAKAPGEDPGRLVEAMRYSLLAPDKRLRPLLVLAAAEAVGREPDDPLRLAAAAVEMVHCYSLIHDDLPAMDDDDFRRGKPTNHKVFGEAIAVLAGDALLTLAFEWLAEAGTATVTAKGDPRAAQRALRAVTALARGAGMAGMVRGQARDLGEAPPASLQAVERLHAEKTGALFRAALEVGAVLADAGPAQEAALVQFGVHYGVAFQHADDLADEDHVTTKTDAQQRLQALTKAALDALFPFDGRAEPLRALARRLAGG